MPVEEVQSEYIAASRETFDQEFELTTYLPDLAKWQQHILIAAIVLSFALAMIHLLRSSIWYDEAITLLTVSGHAGLDWGLGLGQFHPSANFAEILNELYQQDVHPPLYFWTLAVWRVLFGGSLEISRGLSVLFTLGTLWLIYRYASDLGLKWPAVPALLYALSGVGLRYAYNARPYAMASFLLVLTLWAAHKSSRWTGVCAVLCIATHYFTALLVVPLLLFESIRHWRWNRRWLWYAWTSFVLLCMPLAPLLKRHFAARPHQYPGFGFLPLEVGALLKGTAGSAMPSSWLIHWVFTSLFGAILIAIGCRYLLKDRKTWIVPAIYISFLCSFFLLALVTNKSIVKMPVEYYLGLACPLAVLLIASGLNHLPRLDLVFAILFMAGSLTPAPLTKSVNYRQIAEQVHKDCPNCPILVGEGYAGAVPACLLYESKGSPVVLLHTGDSVEDVLTKVGGSEVAILVPTPNEPSPERIEQQLIHGFPTVRKKDYFELRLTCTNCLSEPNLATQNATLNDSP